MLSSLLLFTAALAVLLLAARRFTVAAERIGLGLGMSPFAVGVLIVALGTSLPELVSSVVAVRGGSSEIVPGNVLGANASNLLLVLGAIAIASPRDIRLGDQYIFIDLHFLVGAAFLLALTLMDGMVTGGEGAFLLAAYGIYVAYLLTEGPKGAVPDDEKLLLGEGDAASAGRRGVAPRDLLIAAASAAFIFVGAKYTVDALGDIATRLGVSPAIVAVTLLSLGTTLPELVVSVTASRQGNADVAVGNILGSCVFNSLGVAGVASLVGPLEATDDIRALPLPVFVMGALLFYLLTQDKRISRWEGALFVVFYGLFVAKVSGLV